jgi:outer membrane protein assembly factor BamB
MYHKNYFYALAILVCFIVCNKKQAPSPPYVAPPNDQHISILTQHTSNSRSGFNNNERKLTSSNVNTTQFGKLFSLPVDDQVYAQPLVAGNVNINNSNHNVVYIATVNNSVYAYDADNGTLYWQKNFTVQGMRAPRANDMTGACGGFYQDFSGNIGIVGTPVIDSVSKTMYFVARSTNGSNSFNQFLHAINIVTGAEASGSPVPVTASYNGNGDGSVNNVINFNAQKQNQRQALTLVNGMVFISFSSHCDWGPYHGWILGYNASTLQQQVVYNDTPDGKEGGIWESGMGLAADDQGYLYAVTGNGTVGVGNDPTNPRNRGESALKLSVNGSSLKVETYFTPYNFQTLEQQDLDYGVMGTFLIPNSNYYFTGCKDGNLYLLNKDNMGGYLVSSNQVQQTISLSANANLHCQPSYYKGAGKEFVYVWSENDPLRALPFNRGNNIFEINNQVLYSGGGPQGQSGAMLTVSSNGDTPGTGIVWAAYAKTGDAEHAVSPGVLRAFDATDVSKLLWSNDEKPAQDGAGTYAKFSPPVVANGHVYLATFSNSVAVYGIK